MPRLIQVFIVCSRCGNRWNEGERPEGAQLDVELSFDGKQVVLDLCADCRALAGKELAQWLELGEEPPPPTTKPGPIKRRRSFRPNPARADGLWPCEEPGCDHPPMQTAQARGLHRSHAHGIPAASKQPGYQKPSRS